MLDMVSHAISDSGFMPHGYCYLWTPELLWTEVVSDLVIATSYFSIPVALWQLAKKRPDLPFRWAFVLFGIFVMACGTTHLFSAWNIWYADYWPEAWVKVLTAVTSLVTAVMLWPLIPRVLAIPSQQQLAQAIQNLEQEVEQRKQVEIKLRQLNTELEQQRAQLDASTRDLARSNVDLEQFAYAASHDLQEPLRMVTGYMGLVQTRLQDKLDAETREFMAFAVDGAQRMQALIPAILAYSRVGSRGAPLAPVASAAAFKEALRGLESAITESGAQVTVQTLPRVLADPTQLTQLFQNLIGNAIKFCKDAAPQIQVAAQREGAYWRFSVSDNGIGIAPEYRERIFGIFQRLHTRREFPGTGIGLAICKRIVERHGGQIGVEPNPAGGSVFWFTLSGE